MKNRLQNAFKETPERFSYVIDSALTKAKLEKPKKRIGTPMRITIAVVLIFAVLPSAVFGAVRIYGAIAQRISNFGVSFDIDINEDVPHYIKMSVDIPKGFKERLHSGGLKYDRIGEEGEVGFSIMPMRFYENVDHTSVETDVKEYKKIFIASRPSYELIGTDDYEGSQRYYVWYEEANVLLLIYRGKTITDSELENFVDSISFTKGTEADNDIFFEPEMIETESTEEPDYPEYENVYEEMSLDSEIVFSTWVDEVGSEVEYKAKISDVRITDSINGLDENGIYSMYKTDELTDADGKLLPRSVEVWQSGDGVDTESKLLSTDTKEQKLVLVDIEYTNTTDTEIKIYVPYRCDTLIKNEKGNYNSASQIDETKNIYAQNYNDQEVFYISSYSNDHKELLMPTLKPNEKKIITVGFRCIEEQLSNAYITLNCESSTLVDPMMQYTPFTFTYLIFKVQ